MLKKLRAKFIIVNMSIVLGMLLIIFGMLFHFVKADLENETNTVLHLTAQSALHPGTPKPADTNLHYFVIRLNSKGEVLSYGVTNYDLDDDLFLKKIIQEIYGQRENDGYLKEYGLRYHRIETKDLLVVSFVDVSAYREVMDSIVVPATVIAGVSLLAFFVISLLLARWMVKPVDQAWNKQKQFISDASHELKTPLAVIMSNAELLQTAEDEQAKQLYSNNIVTISHRMRDLVQGLLELSRVDNGKVKQSFARVDFSKLTENSVLPFEPMFFEKGLVFQCNIQKGIIMNGNESYLSQIIAILLDNALKYSAPGIVELQLLRKGRNQLLLSVSNPGAPIPLEDRQRVFDRFYRSDKARTGSGSFGLGLSIAKSFVLEHGGKIWVDANQTGNCFYIQMPCE